jgi:hypothetical protein
MDERERESVRQRLQVLDLQVNRWTRANRQRISADVASVREQLWE